MEAEVELRTVRISGKDVTYFFKTNVNQKNIVLRIKNDAIYVSAPPMAELYEIEHLIQKHYSKISQIQVNYEINNKYDLFSSNPWVKIFDQKVSLFLSDDNINSKITAEGIFMKDYHDNEIQLKKLYNFLKRYYKNWFLNRTMDWAFKMGGLEFTNLSLKNMTSRWGACYTQEKKLIFNTKLLHFSPETIDSVIIHELTHLVYPNHSQLFGNHVHHYCPDYKNYDKLLNSAGI